MWYKFEGYCCNIYGSKFHLYGAKPAGIIVTATIEMPLQYFAGDHDLHAKSARCQGNGLFKLYKIWNGNRRGYIEVCTNSIFYILNHYIYFVIVG